MTVVEVDAKCSAGLSREAMREILVDLVPVLRNVARGLCNSPAEVEDLVQDALEKALRAIDTVDITRNPRGWMVTVLHNLHIDRCRQRARQLPHVPCDDVAIAAPEPTTTPAWYDITVDDLRRAARRLPDELREVYVMFALEGRSYNDIAAALGIAKGTVGTRILRARSQLKKLLTAELGMEDR
jgi:RNA polymerase sigma-70 factor, ECF subfamily